VVRIDDQVPEMDRFEATTKIRENERTQGGHIRIVAMTAHVLKGTRIAVSQPVWMGISRNRSAAPA